jgi:endonuclease/exonuclease/phosphatase family metal-dependent hydrolase
MANRIFHFRGVTLVFAYFALGVLQLASDARGFDGEGEIRLRVMTYNIHHGEGTDGRVDLQRIAEVIRDAKVDLVALQEVDNVCRRSGKVDQAAELARLTEMEGRFFKAIPFEGGEYGQAILSKHSLGESSVHQLPGEPDREQRIAAFAEIDVRGRKFLFGTTHLHHQSEPFRERQAAEINKVFMELAKDQKLPALIAGDLNAESESSVLRIIQERWLMPTAPAKPLFTFSSTKPAKQIDYILASPAAEWEVGEQTVPNEPLASDHLPLVIEWTLK